MDESESRLPVPSPPRRRLQFSLRGLLVTMLVACAGLGYYADQVHRQQAACAAVRVLGGEPAARFTLAPEHPIIAIKNSFANWFGWDAVNTVNIVHLGGCSLSDDDLACLAGLPQLSTLTLTSTPITDEGLVHLYRLKHLEFVDLRFTRVTADGVERLRGFLPSTKIVYRSDID